MGGCANCQRRAGTAWNDILARCVKHSRRACYPCKKLAELNLKLEEMRLAMEELIEERESLASTLNEHHDPITQRLPVELISRTFLHSLPSLPSIHTFDSDFDDITHRSAVFNIGAVCRAWRTVFHSTPSLWAIVPVSLTNKNCEPSVSLIRDWVARSGVLPLYVRLSIDIWLGDIARASARQIVELILLHSDRYEVFEIVVAPDFESELGKLISERRFDHLVHLRVCQYEDYTPRGGFHIRASPTILTMAPCYHGSVSIEWDSLTQFISTGNELFYTTDWLQLLRNVRSLSVCDLHIMDTFDVEDLKDEKEVIHTSLHTLSIQTCPAGFWDRVSFPNLKYLSIGEFDPDDDGNSLIAFQQRSGYPITTLTLGSDHNCGWSPSATASKVICAMPSVEHLTLQNSVLVESLLDKTNAVIKANATPPPLHRIISLRCRTRKFSPTLWSSLLVFLTTMTSRENSSLRTIEISFEQEITDAEIKRMGKKGPFKTLLYNARGLEFCVTDGKGTDLVDTLCNYYGLR